MKKLMFVLTFMCLLAFAIPAYALTPPAISNITNGADCIRWDWDSVPEGVYGYNIELWQGVEGINGSTANSVTETVYGKTYYIQQSTTSGVVYNAHVQILGNELLGWGDKGEQFFIPSPAPIIGNMQPANNEINVPVDKKITFYLSKKVIEDTSNILLKKGEEIVATYVYYDTTMIMITPVNNLEEGVTYTVYLSGITDLVGQTADTVTWNFTTYKPSSSSSGGGGSSVPVVTTTPITISSSYIDTDNHWAKDSVQILVNKQILPSNMLYFYPDNEINREDFVKLLMIGMKYQTSTYTGKFTDVTTDNPNAIYIQTAIDKGIIQGTSETTFEPTKPITREEIFTMFDRTLKLENITPTEIKPLTEFKDYQTISAWATDSVVNIYSLGLVKGKTDIANVIIDPIANTSNAENATLLVRLLEKVGK